VLQHLGDATQSQFTLTTFISKRELPQDEDLISVQ
jgi:hypothetical protein